MHAVASLFARRRSLFGAFLAGVTALAALGYVFPSATEHPLEKYQREAGEESSDYGQMVSGRFDLSRSDAFLVVEVDDLFRPDAARAVRSMVAAVEALPEVDRLLWLDRVPMVNVFGAGDPLLPEGDASPAAYAAARQRVLNHPLGRQLISPDGTTLLMPLVYDWLTIRDDRQTVDPIIGAARGALARAALLTGSGPDPVIRVRLTGRAPLFVSQQEAFDRNQLVFQTLGYILGLGLACVFFRGPAAVFIVASAPALGVFWSVGLVKLTGLPFNPLATVVMPVLVSMVGLADGVHLVMHVRRKRAAGDDPVEAARSAMAHVGAASGLTALTTAVGFASLSLAQNEYVRDFGAVCCVGVLLAFVAVVFYIPYVSTTWIGRWLDHSQERDVLTNLLGRLMGLVDWVLAHRRAVAAGSVLLVLPLAWVTLGLTPDNRLASALPTGSEAYAALAHADRTLGGVEFFRVVVSWDASVESDSPDVLRTVRDVAERIDQEPLMAYPLSIRELLAAMPGDDADLETKMTLLALLPPDLRGFFYNAQQREATVTVRVQDRGIALYKPAFERLEADLTGLAARRPGFHFRLEGQPVRIARDLHQIVTDLSNSLLAESLMIMLVILVAYRSVSLALVSYLPNLLPLVATAALLVASGGTLDMSAVCAFVVCLGIAVDDTVHFLARFRDEVALDGDVPQAVRRAFVGVGAALVMTTIILVSGFGVMLLSDLPGHRTFSLMACSTIVVAIFGDLITMPALLATFYRPGRHSPPEPAGAPVGAAPR